MFKSSFQITFTFLYMLDKRTRTVLTRIKMANVYWILTESKSSRGLIKNM